MGLATDIYTKRKKYGENYYKTTTTAEENTLKTAREIYNKRKINEYIESLNSADIKSLYAYNDFGLTDSQKNAFQSRISNYKSTLEKLRQYDSSITDNDYNNIITSLDSLNDKFDVLSQFKSKKDYDDAIKYRKMATEAASQKRANTLQNIAAEVARDKTPDLPIKGKSVKSISELLNEKSNDVLETLTDKAKSNIGSNNYNRTYLPRKSLSTLIDKSRKQGQLESMKNSGSVWVDSSKTEDLERSYWDTYTDEDNYDSTPILKKYEEYKVLGEKPAKILSYLDENGLTEELKKYKSFIEYEKDKTENELYYQGKVKKFATDTPAAIGESILSVPANLVGGTIAEASNIAQAAFNGSGLGNGRINVYDNWHDLANYAINVRGAVTENIDSDIGRFAYQTGMSMADSAVVGLIAKGIGNAGIAAGMTESQALATAAKIATIPLASSAANQTTRSMLEEGYTPTQAFRMGVASGFAEYITEAYSVESLLKNINGVSAATIATNIRNQALAEGTEEVNSNILNRVFEAGILGSESHNNRLFMYYKEQGLSDKDAYIKVLQNNLYDDFTAFAGGAISGGLMAGGGIAINSISLTNNTGKTVIANGTEGSIIKSALSLPESSAAYKYASKLGNEVTPYQVGRTALLVDEFIKNYKENAIYTAVFNRAIELGGTNLQAKAIAEYKSGVETQKFGSVEELIKSLNTAVSSRAGAIIMDEYRGTGESARKWVSQLNNNLNDINVLEERLNSSLNRRNNAKSLDKFISETNEEPMHNSNIATVLENKKNLNVSDTGNTVNSTTGEEISISGVESLKNGKMTLKLADGSTIDSKDVAFSNETEAAVYDYISDMDINTETANQFIKAYTNDIKPEVYKLGMNEGYQYGKVGYPMDAIKSSFFQLLHKNQQNTAYTMGVIFGDNQAQARQEEINKRVAARKKKGIKRKGGIVFEGGESFSSLTDIQQKSVSVIGRIVSDITHNTVHLYASKENANGKRVFAYDVPGREFKKGDLAPNGFYDENGDIWIDLNAGGKGEGTMLWTAAHEFTHFLHDNSPSDFKALSDFLMKKYGEKGVPVDELIQKEIDTLVNKEIAVAKAKNKTLTYEQAEQQLEDRLSKKGTSLFERAHEEVVARSMEKMLSDTDAFSVMEELKTENHGLWQKIKDFFAKWQKQIHKLYKKYKFSGNYANAYESIKDSIDDVMNLFSQGLVNAGENYQYIATESTQSETKYQLRENAEQDIESALASKNYTEDVYLTETSPSIITSQKGVKNLPMLMKASHIRENVFTEKEAKEKGLKVDDHTHYHGLGKDLFVKIIDGLEDVKLAYRGTKNASNPSRRENYFLLVSQFKDQKGNTVNVPVYINEKGQYNRVFIDTNKVATVFGRDDFFNYIQKEIRNGNLVRIKNRSTQASELKATHASSYSKNASDNSIRQDTENSQEKSSEKSELKYSYAGRTSRTARPSLLKKAQQMESEGKDSEDIRQETGWFRGYDGEWRYEIDDSKCSFIEKPNISPNEYYGEPGFLSSVSGILDHKDLFKAYPALKNIYVVIRTLNPNILGAYIKDLNLIEIDFERYTNLSKEYREYLDRYHRNDIKKIKQSPEYKDYKKIFVDHDYYNDMGYSDWREFINNVKNKFFSSEAGKLYTQLLCGDNEFNGNRIELKRSTNTMMTLIHELQHAIQAIEGFEGGSNEDDENYYRNAGEIEARDAMYRIYLTDEQRKYYLPDIDRTDVTFRESALSHSSENQSENSYKTNFDAKEDIRFSERDYSYEELTSKPDMKVTTVNDNVTYEATSTIRKNIVNQAVKNAIAVGHANSNGNAVVHVKDIDTDVVVSKKSLIHGLDRRLNLSTPVMLKIGEVLGNSIRINELTPKQKSASSSYVLIGYATSKINNYIVRAVVNKYTNEVDSVDVLYAVSTKKETAGKLPGSRIKNALPTVSTISISNLLDYVNRYFPDILPEDVLKHYGHTERPAGEIGESALFSERDENNPSNRMLLADALMTVAQNDIEKSKLQEYQNKVTQLNKWHNQLVDINSQIKDLSFAKGKKDMAKISELRDKATKLVNRINIADKQLLRLESTKALQNVLETEKKKAAKRATERQREIQQRRRESSNKTFIRNKIKRLYGKVERMWRNPTDSSYVPEPLRNAVLDVLASLDIRTGKTNKTQEALTKAYNEYQRLSESHDEDLKAAYDSDMAKNLFHLNDMLAGRNIYDKDLTSDMLDDIYTTLKSIYGQITDAKNLIGENEKMTIRESGNRIIDEQNEIFENRSYTGVKALLKAVDDKTSFFYLNSLRAILKMSNFKEDSELNRLFLALNDGLKKKYDFKMVVNKKLDALVKTKEGQKAFDSSVSDIIDFGWAKMTKMQAAQLMLTLERESNIGTKHIATGGATITDTKYRDNVEKRRDNATLIKHDTLQMMSDIQDVLSKDKWMQDYIEVAKEILRVDSKTALNETSQILKHRDLATDAFYIPFVTDNSFTVREIEGLVHDATIEGSGSLKSITKGAGNALYIEGLDIVLDRCIDTAADYYGLAVPIRNINRALNVKNDESGRSVKDSIKKNWKSDGIKLIEQTLTDIQTNRKNDRIAIIDTIKSAFITSTLNGNISVAIKQAASLDTAFAVLNYRPSAIAWAEFIKTVKNYNSIIDEIDEHTSEHWRRRIGLTTDEIATMKQNSGFFGKVSRKLPTAINGNKWIQMIDCWTTATFWNMAKQDIEKAIKNGKYQLETGSDEYWNAVTDLYEETVEATQPMYDALHRSEMQKNAVSNKIFMFKTQPLQNAGMLYEAAHGLAVAKMSGDKALQKEKARKLGKVIYSQTRSAFTFALMTMIAAAIKGKMRRYKDEDDELTFVSVAERIALDIGSTGTGLLLPIGGSEIYNYLESVVSGNGYEKALLSYPTADWINDYASSLTNVFKNPSVQNITRLLIKFGDITGQPATNYYNLIHGIGYNVKDVVNGDFLEFEASEEKTTSHLLKRAHGAYESGNNIEVKRYIQEIVDSKVAEGKTEKEAKGAIRSSLTSKYKPLLLGAYKNKDDKAMAEIRKFLNATGIYGSASEVVLTTQDWIRKSKE